MFVYYGDNFAADFPQLTQLGDTLVPPPPGSPSVWAQGNSYEKHPQWDPNVIRADMGVIYLDRKLPFDPFPLARFRLDNAWNNKQVTISGGGADSAPTPTTGAGARVTRTGKTKVIGTTTAADYHPEDPNQGMLEPTIRNQTVKVGSGGPVVKLVLHRRVCSGADHGVPEPGGRTQHVLHGEFPVRRCTRLSERVLER